VAVALFGGAFDPPHNGHVALLRAAKKRFGLPLIVLVSEHPGHKTVDLPAEVRLELARAAFPGDDVRLDPHARTIDLLRAEHFCDPLFLVGGDQFLDFLGWKEPQAVLELARLGVATRPGASRAAADDVLRQLAHPERVVFFEIEPNTAASRDLRALAAGGVSLAGVVPPAVATLIEERGLYRAD